MRHRAPDVSVSNAGPGMRTANPRFIAEPEPSGTTGSSFLASLLGGARPGSRAFGAGRRVIPFTSPLKRLGGSRAGVAL